MKTIFAADAKKTTVFSIREATTTAPHKSFVYGVSATTRDQQWLPGTPDELFGQIKPRGYEEISLADWQKLTSELVAQNRVCLAANSLIDGLFRKSNLFA